MHSRGFVALAPSWDTFQWRPDIGVLKLPRPLATVRAALPPLWRAMPPPSRRPAAAFAVRGPELPLLQHAAPGSGTLAGRSAAAVAACGGTALIGGARRCHGPHLCSARRRPRPTQRIRRRPSHMWRTPPPLL